MKIGIVSIKRRTTDYIHDQIKSLQASGVDLKTISLFNGDTRIDHLHDYEFKQINCLPDAVKANHGAQVNGTINHANAILHSNLVLEDDCLVEIDWIRKVEAAILEGNRCRPNNHFILTLWNPTKNWPQGAACVPLPIPNYSGAVAMYVPDELRFVVFEHFVKHAANEPPDVAYASFCIEKHIPMYLVTPFPVRHIGAESVIREGIQTTD